MSAPIHVLFLSEANAARSRMAEALMRKFGGSAIDVHSAGLDPQPVHPLAVQAMAEIGLDVSDQPARHLNDYQDVRFDHVVLLCGQEEHFCPDFPHDGETLHWICEAPAGILGTEAQRLDAFRIVRDELLRRIEDWTAALLWQGQEAFQGLPRTEKVSEMQKP